MSLSVRALGPSDAARVNLLLAGARDETMFLRSNICQGGLAYEGQPLQAKYYGAFVDETLVGVAALCWNGMVVVYAPIGLESLLDVVVAEAFARGPAIVGLSGPSSQLSGARETLGLTGRAVLHDVDAKLFGLNLGALKRPEMLDTPGVILRRARISDLPVLVEWDIGYRMEALGDLNAEASRKEITRTLADHLASGAPNIRLLERDGKLVARTMFGAACTEMVQVGGVWTPPDERGKGYGRAAVAGSLYEAAAGGLRRAVLFAHDANAIRAYQAIGFRQVGYYTLVTLAEPLAPMQRRNVSASPPRPPTAA
jgi:RimJ/RimL family protein N-acetyltransferase